MNEEQLREIFGKNLRRLIDNYGYSQKDVAAAIRVAPTTLNNWCMGKAIARMSKIDSLADFFGVSRADLIEDNSESDGFYIDDEARDYAEFLFKNPEYRVLFNASRNVKKEDLEIVARLLDKFQKE